MKQLIYEKKYDIVKMNHSDMSKKPRNALILTGNLRCSFWIVSNNQSVADQFGQSIAPYNCDIFLVTSYNNYVRTWHGEVYNNYYTLEDIKRLPYFNKVVKYSIIEDIKGYNKKRRKFFNISSQNVQKNGYYNEWGINNGHLDKDMELKITDQYLRRHLGFKLLRHYEKSHNIKYDNIIITRPDIFFECPLNLSQLEDNIVYGNGYITSNDANFSDQFMYGTSATMKKLYRNLLRDYGKDYGYKGYRPEKVLIYYIMYLGLSIKNNHVIDNLTVSPDRIYYFVVKSLNP